MGTRVARVAVNGYGVIGKRVADAVSLQDDMTLAGVADVVTDIPNLLPTRDPEPHPPLRAAREGTAVAVRVCLA